MKILKKHSKKCQRVSTDREHYIPVFENPYFGNKSGGKNNKLPSWHLWSKYRCNTPECPAVIVVNDFEVSELIRQKLGESLG